MIQNLMESKFCIQTPPQVPVSLLFNLSCILFVLVTFEIYLAYHTLCAATSNYTDDVFLVLHLHHSYLLCFLLFVGSEAVFMRFVLNPSKITVCIQFKKKNVL